MVNKDNVTTLAGGSAGLFLLWQVKWEALPYGEAYRLGAAFALIVLGYVFYRGGGPKNV